MSSPTKNEKSAFLVWREKINLHEKLVETLVPFKDTEAFEKYLEASDEYYDEVSTIFQGADIFMKTDREKVNKSEKSENGKVNCIWQKVC